MRLADVGPSLCSFLHDRLEMVQRRVHVVFDVGRVLVRLNESARVRAFKELSLLPESAIRFRLSNSEPVRSFELGIVDWRFLEETLRSDLAMVNASHADVLCAWNAVITKGNSGLLEWIRQNWLQYRFSVASNTNAAHWAVIERGDLLPRLLQSDAFLSFEVHAAKPSSTFFRGLAEKVSLIENQQLCCYVDDVRENVDAATAVGFSSLLYSNRATFASQLREIIDEVSL